MRLLMLGGTGFLGHAIAECAVTAGNDVVCAARGKSGSVPAGSRLVTLDRDEPNGYAAVVAAGPYDVVVEISSKPSFVRAALAALAGHAEHWIYISSGSVYADDATPHQRVDAPIVAPAPPEVDDPTNFEYYGPCKVTCEQAVVEAVGADHALLCRAGLIVGPRDSSDRFTYWPWRFDRARRDGGEVLAPGRPDESVQWIDVHDLAEWLVRAAGTRLTGVFDGLGASVTRGEFLAGVAAGAGVTDSELVWVDQDFLVAQGVNAWAGPRSLPLWLPLPEYGGFLSRDVTATIEAGLTTRGVAETTRATLDWLSTEETARELKSGLTEAEESEILAAWHAAR